MNRLTSGQRVKKYRQFAPLLKKWREIVEKYCKLEKGDAPYWYTERTLVGTLAAAAWQIPHYLSLEEYSVDKSKPLGRGKQRWPGRADLWIRAGKNEYVFEAKHRFRNIGSRTRRPIDFSTYCRDRLNKTKKGAKNINRKSGRALGLLFVAPRITITEKRNIDERINIFLKKLKEVDVDIAWVFPSDALNLRYEGRIYPGVVVLIG